MRVLILTCNTGGGHNAVAAALRDSLQRCGASCDVMDGLGFISKKASKFVSKWHTRFYRRYPKLYKAGYMSAEGDKEMDRRDGPVYRYIARGARRLGRTLQSGGYDAVVCVHVIPAMMMTALKQAWSACPVFCFVATDYTCSPTVGACTPDICVIPHQELADEFVSCGIARDTLLPAGIPVRSAFREHGDRAAARKALGLPETGRHIVLMSGSIGCGPMGDVAEDLDMRMADGDFATVLCGSNKQMRYALELRRLYRVEAMGFTTQVQLYMDSADVLVSKPGGISITEAGTRGVPLLLADMVGGCETRNEAFFTAHGWAASCPPDNMAASALAFLEDEQQRQAITAAQRPRRQPWAPSLRFLYGVPLAFRTNCRYTCYRNIDLFTGRSYSYSRMKLRPRTWAAAERRASAHDDRKKRHHPPAGHSHRHGSFPEGPGAGGGHGAGDAPVPQCAEGSRNADGDPGRGVRPSV